MSPADDDAHAGATVKQTRCKLPSLPVRLTKQLPALSKEEESPCTAARRHRQREDPRHETRWNHAGEKSKPGTKHGGGGGAKEHKRIDGSEKS